MDNLNFELGEFIGFKVQQLAWKSRAQYQEIIKNLGYNITMEQTQVLMSLSNHEGISQLKLADTVFNGRTNISRIIKNLELEKLITREKMMDDKRFYNIYLTDEGRKIISNVFPILVQAKERLIDNIGLEKYDTVMEVIDTMNNLLEYFTVEDAD